MPGRDYAAHDCATADFDYDLPDERIAQEPLSIRDSCRLLVLDRESGDIEHRVFRDIIDYLDEGDLLVVNETRVLPARLTAHKPTGGKVEVLLLDECADEGEPGRSSRSGCSGRWNCLVKPGRSAQVGQRLEFVDPSSDSARGGACVMTGEVVAVRAGGVRVIELALTPESDRSIYEVIRAIGQVPLPPYITHELDDAELYQTVYADDEHSAAAPTAGLHFTPELLARIEAKGVRIAKVRLDVGLDTFRPVTVDNPCEHHIHTEYIYVGEETASFVNETRAHGGRIVAVGTTTTRALETAYRAGRLLPLKSYAGTSGLFIVPGYEFGIVDALITNFHVPRSTLMMMVSAFASRETVMRAYDEALAHEYRFLSFGDAMLIR
ncbi:MAG: tRNA preQ1(34) S-adenosylmethionine ribosyltransferase-isomerase QueA [Coriobacteriia bacterium]|nr:tRNA preQ1(34) S-adenosylmethionine ribosyltransferase-isomerase QueA [Coriobacteriia bacterium]